MSNYKCISGQTSNPLIDKFTTGGPVTTFDINNPVSLTLYWDDFVAKNSVPFTVVPEAPIDENEIVKRQAWTESVGNDRAVSHMGAKGRYQIMPVTLREYLEKTKDIGDIFDTKYNRRVRDFAYNKYNHSDLINSGNPSDSVRVGRKLATYNYGFGNMRDVRRKADSLGVNDSTNFDWLELLPTETRDYVNFILRGKDTGTHRTNEAYKNRKNK